MLKMDKAPRCGVGLTCHLMHIILKRDEPSNLAVKHDRETKQADVFLVRQEPYAASTCILTQPGTGIRNRTEANHDNEP